MRKPRRRRTGRLEEDHHHHHHHHHHSASSSQAQIQSAERYAEHGRNTPKSRRQRAILCAALAMMALTAGLASVASIVDSSQHSFGRMRVRRLVRSRAESVLGLEQNSRLLQHEKIYHMAYRTGSMGRSASNLPSEVDPLSYHASIIQEGCNLTVVFMDPRLSTMDSGSPAWFSLESVALYVPDACVLIQTATCNEPGESTVQKAFQDIYDRALPEFRLLMEQGRVRLAFLDTDKYGLGTCSNFKNPSAAWMNARYWQDEFVEGVDSEVVLVVQSDSVLCHQLPYTRWSDYAFVGAVWPKTSNKLFPDPMEGMCLGMPARYKSWLRPQLRWEKQQAALSRGEEIPAEKRLAQPTTHLPAAFPPICSDGVAPLGNGGHSLRNRTWLVRAIEACPHQTHSGLDLEQLSPLGCKVMDGINDDFYFGIILRALNAPMPTGYEAALFSSEMLWAEQVLELYGMPPNGTTQQPFNKIVWGGQELSVPVGFHKPWAYQPNDLLLSPAVDNACPLLKFIFKPDQSRYTEVQQQLPWKGVGT